MKRIIILSISLFLSVLMASAQSSKSTGVMKTALKASTNKARITNSKTGSSSTTKTSSSSTTKTGSSSSTTNKSTTTNDKAYDAVEVMPTFPGGTSALMQYLSSSIIYPEEAQKSGTQGRVVISFVVERDGSITEIQVARGVEPSLDAEAVRVVKSMPKWNPGKQSGGAVRVKYNMPISFRLQ